MKRVFLSILTLISSCAALAISMKLFWNYACYASDHDISITALEGGPLWLCLDWVRMALLALVIVLSFLNIFAVSKKKEKAAKETPAAEEPAPAESAPVMEAPAAETVGTAAEGTETAAPAEETAGTPAE